jgi:protein SCO1/2
MLMRPHHIAFALILLAGCDRPDTAADVSFGLGDFALTERSGRTVRRDDLRGKVWVASFVFTRCTGPCPQVTATVARLHAELAGEPGVRFVTFTVDPERDDPAELAGYAEHFRADPERWLFLTGPEAEVHRLLREEFKVGVHRAGPGAKPGQEYDHSTRLAVVDKAGRVRGYFAGMGDNTDFEAGLARLKAKVAALLRE